jgi:cation:H+ antiporter
MFAASAVVIVLVGTKLSRDGDRIAELSGLGRLWIGVVLMASATSLPEVFTTASASLMHEPDLAAGNLFGAGLTNMFTLGLIDLLHRQKKVWAQAAMEHTLTAALAMVLTALAAFFVMLPSEFSTVGIGFGSVLLLVLYVLGMRLVFRQEDMKRRQREQEALEEKRDRLPIHGVGRRTELRRAMLGFGIGTVVLLVTAPFLAWSAERIAAETGISTSFIGTSLVGIATALPELVTALAAVRLGAFDLAVGNLFGSNAFNMAAFFFADLAYRDGSLLSSVSSTHALTALWSILMMNLGLIGIIYRAEKRFMLIEPDSLLMILAYGTGLWLLFR